MRKNLSTLLFVSVVTIGLSGCAVSFGDKSGYGGHDVESVFGNVDVSNGKHAGDVETVNGNVTIGRNAKVKEVEVVNGNIDINDFSQANSLETVNGNIEAGEEVVVIGHVKTINGNIKFKPTAQIGANISTVNGDIFLAHNSKVKGDIIFEEVNRWSAFSENKTPKLTLAEGVTIEGQIHLYQPVELVLSQSIGSEKIIRHYAK